MRTITAVIAVALAGCTSMPAPKSASHGDVFYQALDAAENRYQLRKQEDFRTGAVRPDTRTVPLYPAAWLERAPSEVWVCTELHIDPEGAVYNARALYPATCTPAGTEWDEDFRAAVDAATKQWLFEPSYRCTLPEGAEPDGGCRDASVLEAVPVARAYRFVFRRTARGGVVEGGESPP